jgi:DNA-binding MarR family transcriptional regulator
MNRDDDRLIYQLLTAQQKLKTHIMRQLQHAGVRITLGQAGILFLLQEENGRRMNELSAVLGLDNSTMTGFIDRMEKSGYVKRKGCPDDRRALMIFITPSGREQADKAKPVITAVNKEITAGFTKPEIAGFKKVLSRLFHTSEGAP